MRVAARISNLLPYRSESAPAVTLVKIPTTVDAAAMRPISAGLALRNLAKRDRVGDLDMVELKMAKAPKAQRTRNSLNNPSLPVGLISPPTSLSANHVFLNYNLTSMLTRLALSVFTPFSEPTIARMVFLTKFLGNSLR